MRTLRRYAIGTALFSSAALVAGCYAEADVPPPVLTSADVPYGYPPAYYDGYVVYYDGGRPFYYDRGAVVWISPGSPYYPGLVEHYRRYGPSYNNWYSHSGYQYRNYRTTPGYHSYYGYGGRHR
jgi:hypothetical protein